MREGKKLTLQYKESMLTILDLVMNSVTANRFWIDMRKVESEISIIGIENHIFETCLALLINQGYIIKLGKLYPIYYLSKIKSPEYKEKYDPRFISNKRRNILNMNAARRRNK